jgi:hypothetical protein
MQERKEPVSPATRETEAELGSDTPAAIESCGEPALCFAHLSDAARRARASHPAYAGRFPAQPFEPPQSA